MPTSEARIAANRANALKSTGPKSEAGKAASRRNALRHGMAGSGVVMTEGDAAEVARRSAAMLADFRPVTEMGDFLVRRLARLTVRVDRCSDHELAANAYRAVHAADAFAEARIAEVDHALGWIRAEPATHARKLRSMPEGVDRVIALLMDLGGELNNGRWDWQNGEKLATLTGTSWLDIPVTRARALSEAIGGDFSLLLAEDGAGLSKADRIEWARQAMADLLHAEIDTLLEHRKTLDLEGIEEDRASAADRSAFDPSKEAILARRYEAAAERGVYRALNELRRVEAEATDPGRSEVSEEGTEDESLGSFGAGAPEAAEKPLPPLRRLRPMAPAAPTPPSPTSEPSGPGPGAPVMAGGGPA